MTELSYCYDLFFGIKTEEELENKINCLLVDLSDIARFRREDGKPIDDYIMKVLNLPKTGETNES